jgi:hypothetical protein
VALNLGGVIRLTYAVKNDVGAAANPSSATLTITQPDGTVAAGTTITLPPSATGSLVYDFTPIQAGLHSVHWSTTVPTTAEDDVFTAAPPGSMMVSVDEAVNHLNASGVITSDADRETLQWLCFVATDAVERDLGRVIVRRTVTETYNGGNNAIILQSTPVVSITTVVDSGATLSALDYVLDGSILYRGTTSYSSYFTRGRMSVVVTYVAGYSNPPPVCRQAALTLIQSLWQTSQTAFHPGLDETSFESFAGPALAGLSQIPGYDSMRAVGIA